MTDPTRFTRRFLTDDELADTHRVIDRLSDAERASVAAHSAAAARAAITVHCEAAVRAAKAEEPWCCLCGQRHSFSSHCDPERIAMLRELRTAAMTADTLAAMAEDTATSREAAVESNARQVIADLAAGRVGSQTIGDLANAASRARTDRVFGRAINRGMERE